MRVLIRDLMRGGSTVQANWRPVTERFCGALALLLSDQYGICQIVPPQEAQS
jgi:hypothetical protein